MTAHAVGRPCRCPQHYCVICGDDLDPSTWVSHECEPTGPRCGGVIPHTEREPFRVLPTQPEIPPKPSASWLERLIGWWRRPWP